MSEPPREGGGRIVRVPDAGAESSLRDDLDGIVRAALSAVEPAGLVRRALEDGSLAVPPSPPPTGDPGDLVLLAVGKAAPGMVRGALAVLGPRVRRGVVLAPRGTADEMDAGPSLRVFRGGHPLPDAAGVRGARALLEEAATVRPGETILLLLSGGGSALLTLPPDGVPLDDVRTVTRLLLEEGADIRALNTVRKHLDRLKGGGLARAAAGAPIRAAVVSDVVGDPLDVIASGPVSHDPTTFADALRIVEGLGAATAVPPAVRRHLEAGASGEREETPGAADPCFDDVRTVVVGRAADAVAGARAEARHRGYRIRVLGTDVTGEARDVGARLGRLARRIRDGSGKPAPPTCILAAGETTVTVTGTGRGGRNQEVALGAARAVDGAEATLVASVGTDGIDGPTDAAGALATGSTLDRARRAGLDVDAALERNDAYPFFRELGDLIVTGPTGTNVMDLQVILVGEE